MGLELGVGPAEPAGTQVLLPAFLCPPPRAPPHRSSRRGGTLRTSPATSRRHLGFFFWSNPPGLPAGRSQAAPPLPTPLPKLATFHIVQNSEAERRCHHRGTRTPPTSPEPSPRPAAGLGPLGVGGWDPSRLRPPPRPLLPRRAATALYPTRTRAAAPSTSFAAGRARKGSLLGLGAAQGGPAAPRGSQDRRRPLGTQRRAPKKRQFWSSREELAPYGLGKKKKERGEEGAGARGGSRPPSAANGESPAGPRAWGRAARGTRHLRNIPPPPVTHPGSAGGFHAFTLLLSS